jgi:hypothetical protein
MRKPSEVFKQESKFIDDSDCKRPLKLTIADVEQDEYKGKPCVRLSFRGMKKTFTVRQKNGERLTESLGDDFDAWIGRKIVLVANAARATNPMEPAVLAYADGEFRAERRPPTPEESAVAAQAPLDDVDGLEDDIIG